MKNSLPVALAVAFMVAAAPFSTASVAYAAVPSFGFSQEQNEEATEAYKVWKAETNDAKKFELAKEIVSKYFTSTAAAAVAYNYLFPKTENAAQKTEMSRVYYNAAKAAGTKGDYFEYALGNTALAEQDYNRLKQYAQEYNAAYPSGQYKEFIAKAIVAARYGAFQAAVKAARIEEAIQLANEAFAANDNEFLYAYLLTSQVGLPDLANPQQARYLSQTKDWAQRAITFIESGKVPEGAVPEKWEADKPNSLALLYRALGMAELYSTGKSNPQQPEAYENSIAKLMKVLEYKKNDAAIWYLIGQARNSQYAILQRQYDALPEEAPEGTEGVATKTSEAGVQLLAKVNNAADAVIDSWLRVLAHANGNAALEKEVRQPLIDLYKYRHPETPDAWQEEVQRIKGSPGTSGVSK